MRYPFFLLDKMPVPRAKGALGADFYQVYLSARAGSAGESMYEPRSPEFRDPWGRRPNYPPFTNWLYAGIARLRYDVALVLHTLVEMSLFLVLATGFLYRQRLTGLVPHVLLAILCLVFLTPVAL